MLLLSLVLDVILSGVLIHYALSKHELKVYRTYHTIPVYAMVAYILQVSEIARFHDIALS